MLRRSPPSAERRAAGAARDRHPPMTLTAARRQSSTSRARLSSREDLVTMVCGAWLIVGLFLDGWAHNQDKPDSFFTPWHLVFYSGFVATAGWMWSRYKRHRGIPAGYGLGFAGVATFAFGGVLDMTWHQLFGVEVDLEALFSPSHLILFLGALLRISSPLRAAWSDTTPGNRAPTYGRFLPALLSITFVTATVSFFLMEFSPFLTDAATAEPYFEFAHDDGLMQGFGPYIGEKLQLQGFASILIATLVLLAPTLLLLRRWRPPAGSFTVLFGIVAILTSALEGFPFPETLLAAVLGGVAVDVLVHRLSPSASKSTLMTVVGGVVPLVMWFSYFGILALFYSVGWTVEFWSGIAVLSSLAGLGLAILMTLESPAQPVPATEPA